MSSGLQRAGKSLNLLAYGYAGATLAYALLAVTLVRGFGMEGMDRSLGRLLVGVAGASAAWAALGWADAAIDGDAGVLRFGLMRTAVDIARYALWYLVIVRLIGVEGGLPVHRRLLTLAGLTLAAGAAALFATAASGVLGAHALDSPLLFALLALPVFGLFLLEQLFRGVPADFRWHAKPLCLALLCLFAFDTFLYSQVILYGAFDRDSLVVRAPVHAVACLLLFVALRRHSNWLGSLHVSHSAALHTATLVLVGLYLVGVSALGYYVRHFGGDAGRALQLGLLVLALIALALLLASGELRARARVMIGKSFFSYRFDYRTEWLRFTATLTATGSPREVGAHIVRGLADLLNSRAGAIWSFNADRQGFVQSARWNMAESAEVEPQSSTFARFLLDREWIIDLEEYRASPRRYDDLVLPDWLLYAADHWLVVPLIVGPQLVGFVVLGKATGSPSLNWEVLDLLKTAARQAAGFMAQMQATEALLEARKFDAFNRMSAFVVHDLKNIVTQLSLMLTNAKRLHANPEFQQDMLMTVENSLDRMRQLMLQLREGATPAGAAFGVDLAAVAQRIEAMAARRGRTLAVELVERVFTRGHEERLERVIAHMVQNAFDATDPAGRVWLRLDRFSGHARIEVGDTGAGMTQEFIRNRLFKPFESTKQAGMGIGAFESYQYVQELGGSLRVTSEVGHGTQITVLLPLVEARNESGLLKA